MSLLRRAARRVASSPRLAHALLGIEVPPIGEGRRYFDLTTIVLVRVVAPRIDGSSRVLDMGTGAFAAIGLALWKRTGCSVVSSDIDAGLVAQARANVALNGAPIDVVPARFFDGVFAGSGEAAGIEADAAPGARHSSSTIPTAFDCVTFNAPYVPTGLVGDDGGVARYAGQSDGGEAGTDVIEGFLDAFAQEPRVRRAYLGVNTMMVPRHVVEARIRARPGLRLEEILQIPPLPVDVLAISRRSGAAEVTDRSVLE